jgi:DNA (cytosine-5)-methyltransferase 1
VEGQPQWHESQVEVCSLCGAGKREGGPEVRYLSVCSGIEAATVAWHDMGWQPAAFSEIEPFPSAVLAHHYPTVPNMGDMTKYKEWDIGAIDLLVGGTPCQSFSVAGLRKGLADPRGNLALVYLGIADLFKPKWIVWENVPGVLSSGGGRDFGSFLGALAQLGYGFAYRVLDAQWFGVAQRRRRVFVVGYFGDWRPAAAVLFERQSLSGHPKPSREAGQRVAPTVVQGPPYSRTGNERVECEAIVVGALTAKGPEAMGAPEVDGQHYIPMAQPIPLNSMAMQGRPSDDGRMGSGIGEPGDPCPTITKAHSHAVAQPIAVDVYNQAIDGQTAATLTEACGGSNTSGPKVMQPIGLDEEQNAMIDAFGTLKARTLGGGFEGSVMQTNMAVRRLTPVECERLQGFPDNYTEIPWRGKAETPDGPRYKALGNSMAVPVMRWIGQRIQGR